MNEMANGNFEQLKEAEQERIQSFGFVVGASVSTLLCLGLAASTVAELRPSHKIQLESRINPNDAPLASLVRLPGIGMGRTEAIATYRKHFDGEKDSGPAFETAEDLQKVKGIGPKTVQDISQWLKFE